MSCGEALEFQYAYNLDVTEEQYEELVRAKTGSLIGAATEIGAGLNGSAKHRAVREQYRAFGERLGVAFQTVDDLFDYLGDPEITGKPVGYDLAEGKVTLPLIAALGRMAPVERRVVARLMDTADPGDDLVAEVIQLVTAAGGLEYARRRAGELALQAETELEALPPSPARDALRDAIAYAVERRS